MTVASWFERTCISFGLPCESVESQLPPPLSGFSFARVNVSSGVELMIEMAGAPRRYQPGFASACAFVTPDEPSALTMNPSM